MSRAGGVQPTNQISHQAQEPCIQQSQGVLGSEVRGAIREEETQEICEMSSISQEFKETLLINNIFNLLEISTSCKYCI